MSKSIQTVDPAVFSRAWDGADPADRIGSVPREEKIPDAGGVHKEFVRVGENRFLGKRA